MGLEALVEEVRVVLEGEKSIVTKESSSFGLVVSLEVRGHIKKLTHYKKYKN